MISSICMFGDSVARGVIFDAALGKYRFLKTSFVNTVGRQLHINVNNFSKYGCTVTKGNDLVHKHAADLSGYDFTGLEFGGNDCDFDWAAISEHPDAEHLPKTPLSAFEASYSDMIAEISKDGSRPIIFSLPPIDAERYFERLSRGLNADNILRWLGDVNHIYRFHEMYNFSACRLALQKGIPLIDIRSAFLESKNYRRFICEDGIHPSSEGHALIAETIETYTKKYALG